MRIYVYVCIYTYIHVWDNNDNNNNDIIINGDNGNYNKCNNIDIITRIIVTIVYNVRKEHHFQTFRGIIGLHDA